MSKAATADSYSKNMLHQKVFRTIICILFCIIALLPFVLLVMNATRDSESIKAGVSLIPSTHLIENWKNLMIKQNGMQITLQKAIINSATITIPGTFLSVYFSSLTAYGIHVYDFKFKKFAWAFIMAVMMVPSQISIIGFYRFMLDLKLIDTYVPLIIPTIAAPTVVFFMKQYMESTLSLEMIEAARIDGSKEWNTFNKIILPIMKPAVATQAIFQFIAQWNNLFTPTILLTTDSKKTLPMFVQLLSSNQFRTDYGVVYVGLFVTIIPLVVVYLVLSKYIVAGVALGARVIEKHLTLSRKDGGPDGTFSMEPQEFKNMVTDIRNVEKALGKVTYELTEKQKKSKGRSRSLYVVSDIKKGEIFTPDNMRSIRPGYGLHTKYYKDIIGKRASCDIKKGTAMKWNYVEDEE